MESTSSKTSGLYCKWQWELMAESLTGMFLVINFRFLSYIAVKDYLTESIMDGSVWRIGKVRPLLLMTALVGQLPYQTIQYSHY